MNFVVDGKFSEEVLRTGKHVRRRDWIVSIRINQGRFIGFAENL